MYAHVPFHFTWNAYQSLILTKFLKTNECQYNVKLYYYKDHYPCHETYGDTIKMQSIEINAFHWNKTAQIFKFKSPETQFDFALRKTAKGLLYQWIIWSDMAKRKPKKIFFDHWQKGKI